MSALNTNFLEEMLQGMVSQCLSGSLPTSAKHDFKMCRKHVKKRLSHKCECPRSCENKVQKRKVRGKCGRETRSSKSKDDLSTVVYVAECLDGNLPAVNKKKRKFCWLEQKPCNCKQRKSGSKGEAREIRSAQGLHKTTSFKHKIVFPKCNGDHCTSIKCSFCQEKNGCDPERTYPNSTGIVRPTRKKSTPQCETTVEIIENAVEHQNEETCKRKQRKIENLEYQKTIAQNNDELCIDSNGQIRSKNAKMLRKSGKILQCTNATGYPLTIHFEQCGEKLFTLDRGEDGCIEINHPENNLKLKNVQNERKGKLDMDSDECSESNKVATESKLKTPPKTDETNNCTTTSETTKLKEESPKRKVHHQEKSRTNRPATMKSHEHECDTNGSEMNDSVCEKTSGNKRFKCVPEDMSDDAICLCTDFRGQEDPCSTQRTVYCRIKICHKLKHQEISVSDKSSVEESCYDKPGITRTFPKKPLDEQFECQPDEGNQGDVLSRPVGRSLMQERPLEEPMTETAKPSPKEEKKVNYKEDEKMSEKFYPPNIYDFFYRTIKRY